MQSPGDEGDADDSHDDRHAQAESGEEIQDVIEPEHGEVRPSPTGGPGQTGEARSRQYIREPLGPQTAERS